MKPNDWIRIGVAGGIVVAGGCVLWREIHRRSNDPTSAGDSAHPGEAAPATERSRYTMQRTLTSRALEAVFSAVNRCVPWHRLPPQLGVFNLLAFRDVLREHNLHDTSGLPTVHGPEVQPEGPHVHHMRTVDGSYNDLREPEMGMTGMRFGRSVPPGACPSGAGTRFSQPNPREVSRKVMTRDSFIPARTLNLLAAAWIQFQTHDWFNHKLDLDGEWYEIGPVPGDPDAATPMRVPRTLADRTRPPGDTSGPPTYQNRVSHWWDASAIYGSDEETSNRLRAEEDGKLVVNEDKLPTDPKTGMAITGFTDNWWLGLGMLHNLFALEHNAICKQLRLEYPYWNDEQIFCKARLINAALMAKIHTVEWTPAILAHPTLEIGMNANWWGLVGERLTKLLGRSGRSEILFGIPRSGVDHHTAPFALTEEFVSVYRLHPLMPDELEFQAFADGRMLRTVALPEVLREKANTFVDNQEMTIQDVWYSFGTRHPGAVVLHNYPRFMQNLATFDEQGNSLGTIDLAAVDILRDRERGVPRYNQFRRLIHRPPVCSFEELTPNRVWARELGELYEGDIERVDLMAGMYAEPPPQGFGFSDTAFRIFILMASRRLKSDRFFADDLTPEVYTPLGLRWIDDNTMRSVLIRHYPELTPALQHQNNAFAPWPKLH